MEDRTPLRPLRVGEILEVAINIVLKNWRTLMKAVLVVVIPIQILSIAVLATVLPDADLITNQNAFSGAEPGADISGSDIGALFVAYGMIGLLGWVLTAFATAACFKAVSDAYLGATPDWRESLGYARGRVLSLLWVTVLVGFGVVFALIALIIPGIWLYVAWSVAVVAFLFEGVKGTKALGRSFQLVKGRWWPTCGTLLIAVILAALVGGILGGLVSAVALTDVGDSLLGAAIVNGISTGVAQLITTPVTIAIVTIIYFDLRVRKEGVDLETLTERLGVTPEPGRLPKAAQPATGWQSPGGPPPTAPGWQTAPQQQWHGPAPTAPEWQGGSSQPWQGAAGWEGPQPPDRTPGAPSPPPPKPPASPPPPGPAAGGWAPPRPPGAEGDGEDRGG